MVMLMVLMLVLLLLLLLLLLLMVMSATGRLVARVVAGCRFSRCHQSRQRYRSEFRDGR
jgi:hypothetical protein